MPHQVDRSIAVEVGCGAGERPAPLTQAGPAHLDIGVDVNLAVLQAAARSTRTELVCADGMRLPFRSGTVSAVTLRAVLHHLPRVDDAVREFARVLRVGGALTIVDGVALSRTDAQALDHELASAGLPAEPWYGFDVEWLSTVTTNAGLGVESIDLDGTATFATPPFVSRPYTSARFMLVATRGPAPTASG
ncbi:MAG: class I SAM-dependent methyltransferase [Actinomycetia bacterium]|nr:class I SAM-dependent methyltransferase [Actinomycetes bacterium]